MKITTKRILKGSVLALILSLTSYHTASAQSFGSLVKEFKKLDEELSKKKEEAEPEEAEEPQTSQSARFARPGQLSNSGRGGMPRRTFNCHGNSALEINGTPMAVQTPPVLCLPNSSFADGANYTFDVRGLKLPSNIDALKDCRVSSENIRNMEYEGTVVGAQALLFCDIDGNYTELNIKAGKESFLVDEMKMYVCGPEINVEGSEWEKRILNKYNIDPNFITGGKYQADDRDEYKKEAMDNEGNVTETIYIARKSKSPNCSANEVEWLFEVFLPRNSEFNQQLINEVTSAQSAGDDF